MPRRRGIAPPELAMLYSELVASQFNFMREGEQPLKEVHRVVKSRFPQFCDDGVRCEEICKRGHGPEWQHRVRAALQRLKSPSGPVSKGRHGYWVFHPVVVVHPDDVEQTEIFFEGAKHTVAVNAYARDEEAREKCIQRFGRRCFVCDFSFGEAYGPVAESYIHVHHLRALSETGEERVVVPTEDLRPICPNCHAVMHLRSPNPYSIQELKGFLGGRVIRAIGPNKPVENDRAIQVPYRRKSFLRS